MTTHASVALSGINNAPSSESPPLSICRAVIVVICGCYARRTCGVEPSLGSEVRALETQTARPAHADAGAAQHSRQGPASVRRGAGDESPWQSLAAVYAVNALGLLLASAMFD